MILPSILVLKRAVVWSQRHVADASPLILLWNQPVFFLRGGEQSFLSLKLNPIFLLPLSSFLFLPSSFFFYDIYYLNLFIIY